MSRTGTNGVLVLLLLTLAGGNGGAAAQDAPAKPSLIEDNPALLNEMTELFSSVCLEKFPDNASVEAWAKEFASPSEIMRLLLNADAAHAWIFKGAQASYTVTLENPPFHSCSVYVTTPKPFTPLAFFDLEKSYAEKAGKTLAKPVLTATPVNGVLKTEIFTDLAGGGPEYPKEALMYLLSMPIGVRDAQATSQFTHQFYTKR